MSFKDKVVYQVYPKSFYDTNNDGIGDIQGIIEKLDYIKLLGVDYIWLNPIYISPQNDNGYDIENHCAIDPLFGTMEDFERLVKEAQKRNIFIMMDMVLNHLSTKHEWFQKALQGNQAYKNCFIFKKGRDGGPPTNWESKFKGNAWKYVEHLDEYYLHLFHETQADLNWENERVRKEAARIVNFWIDKGVKGFRFDVINLIDKAEFKNDEHGIGKEFYTDRPRVHEYLKELNRSSFGKYEDVITVGEFSSTTIENCILYTGSKTEELTMSFSFHHLKVDYNETDKWKMDEFNFQKLKTVLIQWQLGMQQGDGWNALFWCCHDQPRVLSRYGNDKDFPKESAKMLATALHLLRGTPYIYQGEEIGMTNAYFNSLEKYRDIAAINSYYEMKNDGKSEAEAINFLQSNARDNARTPMQWSNDTYAGFSEEIPWIDTIDNYTKINVKQNLEDKDSIFYYYQKLIQLRKKYKVIQDGEFIPLLLEHEQIFAYKRRLGKEEITVYNNFYSNSPSIQIDHQDYEIILSNTHRETLSRKMNLMPYEALVLRKK